ncbi:hypothetical protein [uncultured Roseovarius sp.]|uniref:hypothetical protein n=1 Tax=uncultured Roseovarius sp. TaxID=293344 RepID=UPI002601AF37|nr:hypothetical protein [uncultured Roseovarius sp.]
MSKKIMALLGLVGALALGQLILLDIIYPDVIAANRFPRQTTASPVTAGDFVVIEADGPRRLCSGQVVDEELETDDRTGIYFNRVAKSVYSVASLFVDEEKARVLTTNKSIAFSGQSSALKTGQPGYNSLQDCKCKIAEAWMNQRQVCMVESSLVETAIVDVVDGSPTVLRRVNRSIAVSLKADPVILPDFVFKQCGFERKNPSAVLGQQISCASKGKEEQQMPLDVKLRRLLGVIQKEHLILASK